MIHYIIVKWKVGTDKSAAEERARALYSGATDIPGINRIRIYGNVTPRDSRYDLMICLFMDPSALPVWDASELHNRWKSEFSDMIEKKCIFDAGEE